MVMFIRLAVELLTVTWSIRCVSLIVASLPEKDVVVAPPVEHDKFEDRMFAALPSSRCRLMEALPRRSHTGLP